MGKHRSNPLHYTSTTYNQSTKLDARSSGLNDHIFVPKFNVPDMEATVRSRSDENYRIKMDLANGFLQSPIQQKKKKKTQTYLRFRRPIDGRFVVLQRLSFGLRSTPFLFASFTHAIKEAAYKLLNFTTKVYIHDWLLTNYSRSHLMSELTSFYELLDLVGVNSNTRKRNVPRE